MFVTQTHTRSLTHSHTREKAQIPSARTVEPNASGSAGVPFGSVGNATTACDSPDGSSAKAVTSAPAASSSTTAMAASKALWTVCSEESRRG